MGNWEHWQADEKLIAMSNTLAHELMHVIDRRYLPNIECEHEISTEITFSEHVRDCFRRGM